MTRPWYRTRMQVVGVGVAEETVLVVDIPSLTRQREDGHWEGVRRGEVRLSSVPERLQPALEIGCAVIGRVAIDSRSCYGLRVHHVDTVISSWETFHKEDDVPVIRIPMVKHGNTDHFYIVALEKNSHMRPTPMEAAQIRSYTEFVVVACYTNENMRRKLLADLGLPGDEGYDTLSLAKLGANSWCFRRASWGPWKYIPKPDDVSTYSLPELLDMIQSRFPRTALRWKGWKADHANVFPAPPAVQPAVSLGL